MNNTTTPTAPVITLHDAVQNCCALYNQTFAAEKSAGAKDYDARQKATQAYVNAIPFLTSHTNIRGFIACAAHAMLLGVMRPDQGTKLLYAAQVALGAIPREPRPAGRPPATPKPVPAQTQHQPRPQPQPQAPPPAPAESPAPHPLLQN